MLYVYSVYGTLYRVARLLTPLGMYYEAAKKRAEPYTKIVEELPEMKRDTVDLVQKAIAENRRSYVVVNNRSEGNAPLKVQALADRLRQRQVSGSELIACPSPSRHEKDHDSEHQ